MDLTAENVESILLDCLLPNNYNDETKVIPIKAVSACFCFDPDKINKHADDIHSMIEKLEPEFDQGYTFMNLPVKVENNQTVLWGSPHDADCLMALGLASGWMLLPVDDPKSWKILPGGVPYVYRLKNREDISDKITTVCKLKGKPE